MKLEPLKIILDGGFELNKKLFFISGNEKTLIEKVKKKIIERYQKTENIFLEEIDSINDFNASDGLFGETKLCLVKGFRELEENNLNKIKNSNCVFIFVQENSQKIKKIKNIFIKC